MYIYLIQYYGKKNNIFFNYLLILSIRVMADKLDWDILVNEFKLQLRYHNHFRFKPFLSFFLSFSLHSFSIPKAAYIFVTQIETHINDW